MFNAELKQQLLANRKVVEADLVRSVSERVKESYVQDILPVEGIDGLNLRECDSGVCLGLSYEGDVSFDEIVDKAAKALKIDVAQISLDFEDFGSRLEDELKVSVPETCVVSGGFVGYPMDMLKFDFDAAKAFDVLIAELDAGSFDSSLAYIDDNPTVFDSLMEFGETSYSIKSDLSGVSIVEVLTDASPFNELTLLDLAMAKVAVVPDKDTVSLIKDLKEKTGEAFDVIYSTDFWVDKIEQEHLYTGTVEAPDFEDKKEVKSYKGNFRLKAEEDKKEDDEDSEGTINAWELLKKFDAEGFTFDPESVALNVYNEHGEAPQPGEDVWYSELFIRVEDKKTGQTPVLDLDVVDTLKDLVPNADNVSLESGVFSFISEEGVEWKLSTKRVESHKLVKSEVKYSTLAVIEGFLESDIQEAIDGLSYEPVAGDLPFSQGYAVKAFLEAYDLPAPFEVSLHGTIERGAEEEETNGFYGIKCKFKNGVAEYYLIDLGTKIVPAGQKFTEKVDGYKRDAFVVQSSLSRSTISGVLPFEVAGFVAADKSYKNIMSFSKNMSVFADSVLATVFKTPVGYVVAEKMPNGFAWEVYKVDESGAKSFKDALTKGE